ncbi:hypothetical protein JFV28_20755 [Pseudomonas sp. TH05]|uniref:hypothetical protein n=1 Tax=unclassified Pseudomonas TaxID=196821 RepID=UPI001913418B|nr:MULTISPECIES: hypothetical protein [unclassified Pseudomonas]MBK5541445.1 hypothetical protein [Pseudomonas sp. TH07]MBK5558276.1 hypothetical protein [Pseudomonas sp. TH05]
MCKWIKAFSLIFILPSVLLINGCHLIAQSRWEGRDVQEALDLFGKPDSMQKQNGAGGETLVLLTWYKSSSWTTTEAAGTSMNHTGNGMVYTEYYQTVGHSSDCKLEATVNKAKKIVLFRIEDGRILHGKCINVPFVPGYIPPGL